MYRLENTRSKLRSPIDQWTCWCVSDKILWRRNAAAHHIDIVTNYWPIWLDPTPSCRIGTSSNAAQLRAVPIRSSHVHWRNNEHTCVSNNRRLDCLLSRLFWRRSKKISNSASLAFVKGIYRWPVNSPHKGPVMRKMFPFDYVIMLEGAALVVMTRTSQLLQDHSRYKATGILVRSWLL